MQNIRLMHQKTAVKLKELNKNSNDNNKMKNKKNIASTTHERNCYNNREKLPYHVHVITH